MKKILFTFLLLLCFALICGCADSALNESSAEGSKEGESSLPILISRAESSAPEEISLPIEDPSTEESDPEEISLPEDESPAESSEEVSEEVSEESEEEPVYDIGDAEFIPSGYLLYNGAAYHQVRYNASSAQKYADMYATYVKTFPGVGVHVINMPASAISITNPAVRDLTTDQREVLDQMESHIYGGVNFINLGETFEAHRGEYLFFKSDFHWTQLGAYYAYQEFAKSVGLTPTPLSAFETEVTTETFIGLTNSVAHDDRINSFFDTIHVYWPRKEHTMAVYLKDMSLYRTYKNCIQTSIKTYSCYLTGDQAYSVINVPENDQDKVVLVIKESSANAFVPFLTEHYGNIIVIDPRHIMLDVNKIVKENGVDDIIFFATASTCSKEGYYNYYKQLIGK